MNKKDRIQYRRIASICLSLIVCVFLAGATDYMYAQEAEVREYVESVIDYKLEKENVEQLQDLLDKTFAEHPTDGVTETYVMAIYRYDKWNEQIEYDYSSYAANLEKQMEQMEEIQPASYQKHCIVLSMMGVGEEYISYALENTIGKDGLMSYVYGLNLIYASNTPSESISEEAIVHAILSYQLQDGGFAYMDETADADVTAMVIQALAQCEDLTKEQQNALDRAIDSLAQQQLADGDFGNFDGTGSVESTAQVLMALNRLDIDVAQDNRFAKNGNTVWDGLMKYRLENGAFSHTYGGKENEMATAQVLEAMVSCLTQTDFVATEDSPSEETSWGYKQIRWIIVGGIAVIEGLYLVIAGRKSAKKAITSVVIAVCIAAVVLCLNIQSSREYTADTQEEPKHPVEVTIEIRCDTILGKEPTSETMDVEAVVPKDGIILEQTTVSMNENDSVYELLEQVCKQEGITLESQGQSYIEGIGQLYEYDYGKLSGWVFVINGKVASESCADYELKDGDEIIWCYSCDLGKDIGYERD